MSLFVGKEGLGLATIKSLRINWIEAASSIHGRLWSSKGQSSWSLWLNRGWLTLRSWQPLRWLGEIDAPLSSSSSSSRTLSLWKGVQSTKLEPLFENLSHRCRRRVITWKTRLRNPLVYGNNTQSSLESTVGLLIHDGDVHGHNDLHGATFAIWQLNGLTDPRPCSWIETIVRSIDLTSFMNRIKSIEYIAVIENWRTQGIRSSPYRAQRITWRAVWVVQLEWISRI